VLDFVPYRRSSLRNKSATVLPPPSMIKYLSPGENDESVAESLTCDSTGSCRQYRDAHSGSRAMVSGFLGISALKKK